MLDFPAKQIKIIRNLLLRKQREIEKNLNEIEKEDPAKNIVLAESSEPGTDSYIADTHTKSIALKSSLEAISRKIKAALIKIKKGNFGKCERCGKKIEISRLMVMPMTQHCLSCSKKLTTNTQK